MPTKSNNTGGRGGARPGAGRKKKSLAEKIENGNTGGKKLKILDIPDVNGVEMPKPHYFFLVGFTLSAGFKEPSISPCSCS